MEHASSPTNYPGRTPIQIVGRLLFSVIILAAGRTRTSNQIVKESGSSPTSPPRRTLFISVRLCGNAILLGLPLPLFSGPKIPLPGNREPDCGDPGGRG